MKSAPSLPVTQKAIAKALGLAQSTVASALNPKIAHKLLPETVALIKAKAEEMNYRPQRQARILRTGRSHTLGVIGHAGLYHGPQERIRHLAHEAIDAGYQLISIDIDWFKRDLTAACHYMFDASVDGVILCNLSGEGKEAWWEKTRRDFPPVVSLNSTFEVASQTQFDLKTAFREITRHHMEQGSRRLQLQFPYHDPLPPGSRMGKFHRDWIEGFSEAIASAGGEVITTPELADYFELPSTFSSHCGEVRGWVRFPLRVPCFANMFDVGYHETLHALDAAEDRPDALICTNDEIATGALLALKERGIAVPQEITVSGGDNFPYSRYCNVPLTTIEQPSLEMAKWSIRRLVELIENPTERHRPSATLFPCEIIHRTSTLRLQP